MVRCDSRSMQTMEAPDDSKETMPAVSFSFS
jgi:hypothetical protein